MIKKRRLLPFFSQRHCTQADIRRAMARLAKQGKLTYFDDEFYAQFDDMYYQGLPVYYHLKAMSMGKCFDSSMLLALAMGKQPDINVCRGTLESLNESFGIPFVHGWVERGNDVYDTTWQARIDKTEYYQMFDVAVDTITPAPQFFNEITNLSEATIYHRADYESGRVAIPAGIVTIAREIENLHLADHPTPAQVAFSTRFLNDLPDLSKCRSRL